MSTRTHILVTGSMGQLGRELKTMSSLFPGFEFHFISRDTLDIVNEKQVNTFFTLYKPVFCVNCAAYTAVDKAENREEKESVFKVNADGVSNLAKACARVGCRFIHISTDYVFDGNTGTPYQEDSPVNPQSVYGASKLAGEKLAFQYNPETVIIRTSWLYSPFGKNFVKTMLKLMKEKDELNVVNDQIGSPTYAADLAEVIMKIIADCHSLPAGFIPGIYHFCNQGVISWYDFAQAIKELTGNACTINPISTLQYPTAAKRPHYSVLDTSKIQEIFGVHPKNWKTSLAACLARL